MNRHTTNPHTMVLSVLPWYVNATLSDAECTAVEAHLARCDSCATAYEQERALAAILATGDEPVADAAVALARLESQGGFEGRRGWLRAVRRVFTISPPAIRGLVFAQAVLLAGLAVSLLLVMDRNEPTAQYQTVSTAPLAAAANFDIVFVSNASHATITALLAETHSQVIAGPNAAGAYTIQVANNASRRQASVIQAKFKASPAVRFVGALNPAHQ